MALTTNLVSFWELEAASGTRVDSTGTGNDLTDNNTVTQAAGRVGNSAQFTATNLEYLSHSDAASLDPGDNDFSFIAWAYLNSKPITPMSILTKSNTVGDNRGYYLLWSASDVFTFSLSTDGTSAGTTDLSATTFGAPSLSTWYMIAVTYNAGTNTLSIGVNGGTMDTASVSPGPFDGTASFLIGAYGQSVPVFYWDGRIDQVGLWSRVISGAEITALYNAGSGLSYAAMVGGGSPTYTLSIGQGSFALTGESALLIAIRVLAMAQGAFTLTGIAVGLLARRLLTCAVKMFNLTGFDLANFGGTLDSWINVIRRRR